MIFSRLLLDTHEMKMIEDGVSELTPVRVVQKVTGGSGHFSVRNS